MMRAGYFEREDDVNGVSGTGRVAEFVEFSDGMVVVNWLSHTRSTNIYQNIKQAEAIHSHGGKTKLVTVWEEPVEEVIDEPETEE